MTRTSVRVLAGAVIGFVACDVLSASVVVTKFGLLVGTPRAWHAAILVALFVVPAIIGWLAGLAWRRPWSYSSAPHSI